MEDFVVVVVVITVLFLTRHKYDGRIYGRVVIVKQKYCFCFDSCSSFMIPASFIRSLHKFIILTNFPRSNQQNIIIAHNKSQHFFVSFSFTNKRVFFDRGF